MTLDDLPRCARAEPTLRKHALRQESGANQCHTIRRSPKLHARVAELEARLVQAQKMSTVGSLPRRITHEFNNILTTVINYAKLGLRHKDDATREKSLDKILAAGIRASKITTGLLAYARRGSATAGSD